MGLSNEQAANVQGQEELSGSGGNLWLRRLGDVEKLAQNWRLLRGRPKSQTQISKLLVQALSTPDYNASEVTSGRRDELPTLLMSVVVVNSPPFQK